MDHPDPEEDPCAQSAGVQVKKSSFQITSVTPALSVSTSDSTQDDAETSDDLDESHAEDLSTTEILDVAGSDRRLSDPGVHPGLAPTPVSSTSSQPTPAPTATTTTTSPRFKIVKLETFKRRRWTCSEFYDKVETIPSAVPASLLAETTCPSGLRQGDSVRQFTPETSEGSEMESTIDTLSHYTDSMHGGHWPPGSIQHPPVSMTGNHTAVGVLPPSASPHSDCTQCLAEVQQQQQTVYTSQPQQPSASSQAAQVQVTPPDYVPQPPAAGLTPASPADGAGHTTTVPQQQAMSQQPQVQQNSPQATTSTMVPQTGAEGLNQQPPGHIVTVDQQQSLPAHAPVHQVAASSVPASNMPSDLQPQALHGEHSGGTAPQSVSLTPDLTSAQVQAKTAKALYDKLPNFTTTELEDAQRLLVQHQSTLSGIPDSGVGANGTEISATSPGASTSSVLNTANGQDGSSPGDSAVAIDNKIEQAMDLVKSHLMYAVREEVEVLKEQIKELINRNSKLEQENEFLKTMASPEQMAQFQAQVQTTTSPPATAGPPGDGLLAAPSPPIVDESGDSTEHSHSPTHTEQPEHQDPQT